MARNLRVGRPGGGRRLTSLAAAVVIAGGGIITPTPTPSVLPSYATIATFGDSITVGRNNADNSPLSWAALIASTTGATLTNAGISGSVLQNSADSTGSPRADNGRDRVQSAVLGANKRAAVFIAYGLNDARYVGAQTTFNVANYKKSLRETVTALLTGGYAAADIYIGTPYYITDAGLATGSTGFTGQSRAGYEAFVQAALEVAAEFGTKACDLYSYLRDNGFAATLDTDNIHPSAANGSPGHALIARAWQTQTYVANTRGKPTTTGSLSGSTITLTASAVASGASYEYALVSNFVDVATNTSGIFTGVNGGAYFGKARALFADGTKGPWAFTAAAFTLTAGARTAKGQTESYATTADNTLLSATAPTLGAWTRNGYSTGTAAIGTSAIRGPAAVSSLAVYHLAAAAYGNGQYGSINLSVRSNATAPSLSAGIVLRSDPAAQNYLTVFYNGVNIRLFKVINGNLQQIGTTYTAALTGTPKLEMEAVPSGANCAINILLDGVSIISVTEAETNLSALGTGMGIRMQTGTGASYDNTSTGTVITSATFASIN